MMKTLTLQEIRDLGRDIPEAFSVEFNIDGAKHQLIVTRVLRNLPAKRLVVLTSWCQKQVVAKLFIDPSSWSRHREKEKQGIAAITIAKLRTVEILAEGTAGGNQGGLLIFNYLGEHSMAHLWEADNGQVNRKELLAKAVAQIAMGHECGLWQRDIHLGNFFLYQDEIFMVDGADVQFNEAGTSLGEEQSLENLALFFAQFPVANDLTLEEMYSIYLKHRNTVNITSGTKALIYRIDTCRQRRIDFLQKKLYRETTAHRLITSWDRFLVIDRKSYSSDLEQFIDRPDEAIEKGEILKNGNTSTVALIKIGGRKYVVKRNNIKNFWHGLSRLLRPSRAWNSWRNAHILLLLGILTPAPVLMLEVRIGWLRRKAYYLSEYVPVTDVLHLLQKENINAPRWNLVLQQFENLFQILKRYQIMHGDMKATNFISAEKGLYVLDLDSMAQMRNKTAFRIAYTKDLNRFARNWQGVEDVERRVAKFVNNLQYEE